MISRIVEIADDNRHLCVDRGLLVIQQRDERAELGRVPLDDICAVIANAHGLTYSNNVLVALSERGAPLVVCGNNHRPVGFLLTLDGHYQQAGRIDAQVAAALPTRKRLWASLVKAKIYQQAYLLELVGKPLPLLATLGSKVRPGDPENLEAQAAKRYWGRLFGDTFRRDRSEPGINAMLNYGYTVLRAAVARSIVASGLHPSLGIHHSNDGNAMRLVDDLMEPFRPLVDATVYRIVERLEGAPPPQELTPNIKRDLVSPIHQDLETGDGISPLLMLIENLSVSLAQVYLGLRRDLHLPQWRLVEDSA